MAALLALVFVTSFGIFADARRIGYDPKKVGGLAGMSPGGWLLCGLTIWIVAVPLYLSQRSRLVSVATGAPDAVGGGSKTLRFAGALLMCLGAASWGFLFDQQAAASSLPECGSSEVLEVAARAVSRLAPGATVGDASELPAQSTPGVRMCVGNVSGGGLPAPVPRLYTVQRVADGRVWVQLTP